MAGQLIECVPNYSEGKRTDVIEAVVEPFRKTKGCRLFDYSADPDHNRLVVSLVGEPEAVQSALIESARIAMEHIDMERHRGEHPRIGAVDVIPFVPLREITMEECTELAHAFGARYYKETGIPVYFCESAALKPERKRLEAVRKGQYETLKVEVAKPERHPDVGEPKLHPTAGATVVMARNFLVAFNVNLGTDDITVAERIAKVVRASSGGLTHVKGIGVKLEARGLVQVSMNIVDHKRNPLYRVLELVRMEAKRWGVEVVETEIYGMVPTEVLLDSAAYYLQSTELDAKQVIELKLLDTQEENG